MVAEAEAASPELLIVVVNYRTAGLVIDCLRSLEAEVAGRPGARVVVTDNDSGDDSVARLESAIREGGWAGWAEVRPLGRNGGFSAGNNAAIRPALESADPPRYVWLLNPDTVVRPGSLGALVDFLEDRPDVGIAGSRLEDPDGTPQRSAFRFPSVLGELEGGLRFGPATRLLARWVQAPPVPDAACRADWLSGASLMARREVFESVGLLDDGYFMYYEEVDLCRRAYQAGWPSWYVPASRVVHLVGQSTGIAREMPIRRRMPSYWFDSRRRYFRRNLGAARGALANLAWAAGFATYRARQAIQGKPDHDPDRLLRDFLRHNLRPSRPAPTGSGPGAEPPRLRLPNDRRCP